MSKDKIDAITLAWKRWVQREAQPPRDSTWVFVDETDDKGDLDKDEVRVVSDASGKHEQLQQLAEMGFTIGKLVQISKRHTGTIGDDTDTRKDVPPKAKGHIVGHCDTPNFLKVAFELDQASSSSCSKKKSVKTTITINVNCHVDKLRSSAIRPMGLTPKRKQMTTWANQMRYSKSIHF